MCCVDTGSGVLTSDIGSLSDEDILTEFREENQMEVDDGDDGNEDEQEETPKRPTKSEDAFGRASSDLTSAFKKLAVEDDITVVFQMQTAAVVSRLMAALVVFKFSIKKLNEFLHICGKEESAPGHPRKC
ncbi:hypothetical protein ACROYT_G014440 [Oculina patagonica]